MKRSELLKLIQEEIECCFDHYDTCSEIYSDDIVNSSNTAANRVLNKLEELGVQPPAVKEPCSSFVLKNGQYIQVEDSFVFTNRWDAE